MGGGGGLGAGASTVRNAMELHESGHMDVSIDDLEYALVSVQVFAKVVSTRDCVMWQVDTIYRPSPSSKTFFFTRDLHPRAACVRFDCSVPH